MGITIKGADAGIIPGNKKAAGDAAIALLPAFLIAACSISGTEPGFPQLPADIYTVQVVAKDRDGAYSYIKNISPEDRIMLPSVPAGTTITIEVFAFPVTPVNLLEHPARKSDKILYTAGGGPGSLPQIELADMQPMAAGGRAFFINTGGENWDEVHIFTAGMKPENEGGRLSLDFYDELPVSGSLLVAGGGGGGGTGTNFGGGTGTNFGGGGGGGFVNYLKWGDSDGVCPFNGGTVTENGRDIIRCEVITGSGGEGGKAGNYEDYSGKDGGATIFNYNEAGGQITAGGGGGGGGGTRDGNAAPYESDGVSIPEDNLGGGGGGGANPGVKAEAATTGGAGGTVTGSAVIRNGGNGNSSAGGGGGGGGKTPTRANSETRGGDGGDGLACEITGSKLRFGGGGGGGGQAAGGRGGPGGGDGAGNSGSGQPGGTYRTGGIEFGSGGGGGGGGGNSAETGGRGADGVVIVRFPFSPPPSVLPSLPE